jgi:hypothetical protein
MQQPTRSTPPSAMAIKPGPGSLHSGSLERSTGSHCSIITILHCHNNPPSQTHAQRTMSAKRSSGTHRRPALLPNVDGMLPESWLYDRSNALQYDSRGWSSNHHGEPAALTAIHIREPTKEHKHTPQFAEWRQSTASTVPHGHRKQSTQGA